MHHMSRGLCVGAALSSLFLVGSASAADVIIGDDDLDDQAVVVVPSDEELAVEQGAPLYAPRVYGWSYASANCGTFRYWNGEYCADARDEPPR